MKHAIVIGAFALFAMAPLILVALVLRKVYRRRRRR